VSTLELRPYGPDSTAAEISAIAARVSLLARDVLLIREVPHPTLFSVDVCCTRLQQLMPSGMMFACVLDMSESRVPPAEVRAHIKLRFGTFADAVFHAAVFTDSNAIVTIAARFVMAGMGLRSYSCHATFAQALRAVEDARAR
jgi:hypothetical protein